MRVKRALKNYFRVNTCARVKKKTHTHMCRVSASAENRFDIL